ncbi:hypothetical protein R5O87_03035 [Arthrobacter globiformis]|uniref:hypothetical protein n=1 Tax=Arthrobacter globiformis TaxID=1665 RepID=UPI00397C864F
MGDLRKVHEESKDKQYVSSLDWIASGAFVDRGQPDDTPLFPRFMPINPSGRTAPMN